MTPRLALAPLRPAIPAGDGFVLRGELQYPRGRSRAPYALAVLAHQYPSTRDSWAPFCADLHSIGVATLVFDLRGHGESIWTATGLRIAPTPAEPTMAAFGEAFMDSAGAVGFRHIADDIVRVAAWGLAQNFIDPTRLLLGGASVGGTGALLAAPRLAASLCGIVTFGAAGAGVHSADAMERIRANCEAVRAPMLLTTSAEDPFDGANNVRTWSKGLPHVATRIVDGGAHAMAIYGAIRANVVAFSKRSTAGARRTTRRARGRR